MWNLAKGNDFLLGVSLGRLQKLYAAEKNGLVKLRLLSAIHRRKGKSLDFISELINKPKTTVQGWLHRFQERGIEAKNSIKQTGRPAQLSVSQRKQLVKILERGPPNNAGGLWTTKNIKDLIRKKYGHHFSHSHTWLILTSLGFTIQRPRKKHYKTASPGKIKAFKKKPNGKPDITERKVLSWARKMKQPLGSSHSLPEAGQRKAVGQQQP